MQSPLRLSALFLSALVLSVLQLSAAPPSGGGGGGGGTSATGTIYYHWSRDTLDGWPWLGDWTMNAAGSDKQLFSDENLFYNSGARLSYQSHVGKRWLLEHGNPVDNLYSTINATCITDGSTVVLANTLPIPGDDIGFGSLVWGKDDSFMSVVVRDWANPDEYCHLFRAAVSFDVDGVPSFSSPWEWVTSGDLPGKTDIATCDWSFDGQKVALGMQPNDGKSLGYINVFDLATMTTTVLATNSFSPRWSPTLNRIAFKPYDEGVFTINPDGSGLAQLTTGNGDLPQDWSPDGKYILFQRGGTKSVKGGYIVYVADVCYVPSAGGKVVNLTGDIDGYARPRWWR